MNTIVKYRQAEIEHPAFVDVRQRDDMPILVHRADIANITRALLLSATGEYRAGITALATALGIEVTR